MKNGFQRNKINVLKAIVQFLFFTLIAKSIAFGRELVLSYYFGASEISDVYLLSVTLPVTVFGFISSGIVSGFIPIYQRVLNEKSRSEALLFCNRVINAVVLASVVFIVVYYMVSKHMLRILAGGLTEGALYQARCFTNISIWAVPLIAVLTVLCSYLQINGMIRETAVISVPLNICIIITIIVSFYIDYPIILPCGFLLSNVIQVVFVLLLCHRVDYGYKAICGFHDPYLRAFIYGMGMLVVSSSISQINILVDRSLATWVVTGGLSIFEYANRIIDLIMGLTIIPISTVFFPAMTDAANNVEELSYQIGNGVKTFCIVIIPLTAFVCIFSDPIINMIYLRGAFDGHTAVVTSSIVSYYAVGLLFFALRDLFTKAFYAMGDIKTPMLNSLISFSINIILNFVLIRIMGLSGLAFATSISACITTVLLYSPLRKRIRNIIYGGYRNGVKYLLKILLITTFCSMISLLMYRVLYKAGIKQVTSMMAVVFPFCLIYMISLDKMRILDIKSIIRKFHS